MTAPPIADLNMIRSLQPQPVAIVVLEGRKINTAPDEAEREDAAAEGFGQGTVEVYALRCLSAWRRYWTVTL